MSADSDVRIFLCTTPTKMQYSFERPMGRAQEIFDQDPTAGHLFLFINHSRDRMKILFWDRDGFCIWYKRLERGTFQLLTTTNDEEGIELDYAQLVRLLGGLDLRTGRRRRRSVIDSKNPATAPLALAAVALIAVPARSNRCPRRSGALGYG